MSIYTFDKEKALEEVQKLESSLGSVEFEKKYDDFLRKICQALDIHDSALEEVLALKDPFLIDRIVWKYMHLCGLGVESRQYKSLNNIDKTVYKKRRNNMSLLIEPLQSFGFQNTLPSVEVYNELSAYVFINKNPYLVTLTKENFAVHDTDDFHSEQKWADKETAILIALINLSKDYGWYSFFISDESLYVPIGIYEIELESLNKENLEKIEKIIELYEYINKKTSDRGRSLPRDFSYQRDMDLDSLKELNALVDRKDSALIRCLYYFAKACAFVPHRMLMEESTALQLFCLDGLSKLLMKKYKLNSLDDLGVFLEKKFKWPYREYLKELYDERTIYVHPLNIHGDYWCPPWDADTCFDTLPIVRAMILLYLTEKYDGREVW